jgi:hypothetical protein
MIAGVAGAWSTPRDMVLTSSNKENHKPNNDASKTPQRQNDSPLCTINGPFENDDIMDIENRLISELQDSYKSLFDAGSEDESDDAQLEDPDEVGRMLPGVLGAGMAYTVKETLIQGYIEKKGSGFDWLGSRAWKRRWAVLVVRRR